MDRKIKVAVVGAGFFGERHVKIYTELPNVHLAAVVDKDEQRARDVAKRYADSSGMACAVYSDISPLVGRIDAASIATPTRDHAPVALSLLNAGIHLLIEKPMTATLEEADAIEATAAKMGKIVHVGHIERYNPALMKLREYPLAPRAIECRRVGPFVERAANVSVVLDLMIHDIDIVLALVSARLVDVRAVGLSVVSPYTDIAHARLSFADGTTATLTASRVADAPLRMLQVFQDQTYFEVNYQTRELTVISSASHDGQKDRQNPDTAQEKYAFPQGNPLKTEIAAFVDAISAAAKDPAPEGLVEATDSKPPVSHWPVSPREAIAVALSIMESIQASGA